MAAIKSAPLRNSARANAVAAYEHDELAAPSADATTIVFADESGRSLLTCSFETIDSTMAERMNPKHSAQRISQAMMPVICSAWRMACIRLLHLAAVGLFDVRTKDAIPRLPSKRRVS